VTNSGTSSRRSLSGSSRRGEVGAGSDGIGRAAGWVVVR
jgi:hypothetical protein